MAGEAFSKRIIQPWPFLRHVSGRDGRPSCISSSIRMPSSARFRTSIGSKAVMIIPSRVTAAWPSGKSARKSTGSENWPLFSVNSMRLSKLCSRSSCSCAS